MAARYDHYWRLEPHPQQRSFAAGFAAAVHDPVWFLARQWQMGEHHGENASTPVLVELDAIHTPIEPSTLALDLDPTTTPAEAIVEAERDDWWTIGRRVRIRGHRRGARKSRSGDARSRVAADAATTAVRRAWWAAAATLRAPRWTYRRPGPLATSSGSWDRRRAVCEPWDSGAARILLATGRTDVRRELSHRQSQ